MRLVFVFALFIIFNATTVRAETNCDFATSLGQADFAAQGFQDVTKTISADAAQWQKYRQNLQNVQRIYKNDLTQSLIMLGYSPVPEELAGETGAAALLQTRMNRLRQSARDNGYDFRFSLLLDRPVTAEFTAASAKAQQWPYLETGIEILTDSGCWAVMKLGSGKSGADSGVVDAVRTEFMALRNELSASPEQPALDTSIDMNRLPQFNSKNFWDIMVPTAILALLFAVVIGRAARAQDNMHVVWYFRLMTAAWIIYVLGISVFKAWVLPGGYPIALEHYVYAAVMLTLPILGIMFGSGLALLSLSFALGHSVRTSLFLLFGFTQAPMLVWFDVGLMTLLPLYVLVTSFRRRHSIAAQRHAKSVIDRSH